MTTPNLEQQQVIDDLEHNIILFASAGTGKTYTIAKRIENILKSKNNINPEDLLCLTFTVKACAEMKEDIISHVGEMGKDVEVRTIHSFLFQIIKQEEKRNPNYYSELMICDDVDEETILHNIFYRDFGTWYPTLLNSINTRIANNPKSFCEHCKGVITSVICDHCDHNNIEKYLWFNILSKKNPFYTLVSTVKRVRFEQKIITDNEENDFQNAFDYLRLNMTKEYFSCMSYYLRGHKEEDRWVSGGFVKDTAFEKVMSKFIGKFIQAYNDYLRQANLIDFDDISGTANQLLDSKSINSYWSNKYKYITVDEMQDTSMLEYSTLKKVFGNNHLMMCGDFFQTIYAWRGSNPKVILTKYKEEFKAKTYMFSENYRSTRNLTGATFGYLRNMFPQLLGDYCPTNIRINSQINGDPIVSVRVSSTPSEASFIYNYLESIDIPDPSRVCIMARSNSYIENLTLMLEACAEKKNNSLKFFTIDKEFRFFKRPIVKDFFAFLRLLVNNTDTASMERIVKKFVKGVGDKKIEDIRKHNPQGVMISSFIDPVLYQYGDIYYPLLEAIKKSNIVVYDTESTGLDLDKDQIVQISAIKLDNNGNIIDSFDQMVIPTVEISQGAFNTHHFDMDYILSHHGIAAKQALEKFSCFVKGSVLVGHNSLAFDKPLIQRQLIENNLPDLDIKYEFDTLVLAKRFLPHLKNYKLATVCEYFDVTNKAAHNAMGDIEATSAALYGLVNNYIIPTSMSRVAIFEKYKAKFEGLFGFFSRAEELMRKGALEELYDHIVKEQGFIKKYDSKELYDLEDLKLLMQCDTEINPKVYLQDLLNRAALSSGQIDMLFKKLKRIPIITVHQSKGCEFDLVIIAGCDNKNFPSYSAVEMGGEEEERNVFYVAISRAKKKLILTSCEFNDYGKPVFLSPYVKKIPNEYMEYIDYTH